MPNAVEIANMALSRVGSQDIMSLGDTDDENARIVNRFFNSTVREVLRTHQWTSATKIATLTKLSAAPDFGWGVQYVLPQDFVRAIYLNDVEVWDPHERWVINGGRLLTDETQADLVYIYFNESSQDTSDLDPLLAEAISLKLAYKIGPVLTGDPNVGTQLLREYELAVSSAKTADGQESRSAENHPLLHWVSRSPIARRRFISPLG